MSRWKTIMAALGAGAAAMYLADPDRGKRRRALLRDKVARSIHESRDIVDKTTRDVANRARGMAAGVRSIVRRGPAGEDVLVARVRSRIGRVSSHPHAIRVSAHGTRIVLEGDVLQREAHAVAAAASSVSGVSSVENRLQVHESADTPALQGGHVRPGQRWELLQSNWTPAVRMVASITGAALLIRGLSRGGVRGGLSALAGTGLLLRAGSNEDLSRALGVDTRRYAVDIQKTLNIQAPVERVYAFWTNYQNFPRFMTHLKEVRDLGNNRSHWVAAGPAGVPVSWDAEIIEKIENKVLSWRSVPGSQVNTRGSVRFDPNPDGGTRITVRMSYTPPVGLVGHAIASLFGADPKREMDEDLIRLKSLIEFGKTRAHGGTVRREELGAPSPG
jgi:uncharacterized membrane protein